MAQTVTVSGNDITEARPLTSPWQLIVGAIVSALLLWLATRNVEWRTFVASIRRVHLPMLGLGAATGFGAFAAMALRWRTVLGRRCPVAIDQVFHFTMIGFLAGLVIPQRLGDLVKIVLLARKTGYSRTMVFGSVVIERLSDVVILLLLAGVFAATMNLPAGVGIGLAVLAAATIGLGLILLFDASRWRALETRVVRMLPEKIGRRVDGMAERFSAGTDVLRDRKQAIKAFGFATLVWSLAGLSMVAYVKAFDLQVPWYAGLFVLVLTNFAGILPSSPGGIGVYHYFVVLGITTWTHDRAGALSVAVVSHAMSVLVVVLAGSWSLTQQRLSFGRIRALSTTA